MGVDAFPDRGVASDLGNTGVFHQGRGIGATNVVDRKVGKIDHSGVIRHREMLCIGDSPEMSVIPFVFSNGDSITIFFE